MAADSQRSTRRLRPRPGRPAVRAAAQYVVPINAARTVRYAYSLRVMTKAAK
jgi:hypothetical protein